MPDPHFGALTTYGPRPKFSVNRMQIRASAPRVGQHNAQVYAKIGFAEGTLRS